MLETINNFVLQFSDPLFNWILSVPRDLRFVIAAVITSGCLALARKFATDQEWLKRADEDQVRLKQLVKEAKKAGDKEAVTRYKGTMGHIKMLGLKYEGKPLLIAIVPILLIATWAFCRLGNIPPAAGAPVEVKLYVPASAIGNVVHMLPQEGLNDEGGWIKEIVRDKYPESHNWWDEINHKGMIKMGMLPLPEGVATWNISGAAREEPYKMEFIYKDEKYDMDIQIGQKTYSTTLKMFPVGGPVQASEVVLKEQKMFGIVPGIPIAFHMPPWMLAYLIIVMALYPLNKHVFKIY